MPSFSQLWNQSEDKPTNSNFESLWNQSEQPVAPPAPPDPIRMLAGQATQGAADLLGGFTGFLNDHGVNTEAFFKPARTAARTQKALSGKAKIYAAEAGLADLGDAVINTPAGLVQQGLGIDPAKRWRSDMAGFIENFPAAREAKEILPEAFNSYKTTAGFLAPLPGGGVAKTVGMAGKYIPAAAKWSKAVQAGSKGAQIADIAATGGALGGVMSVGEQVKANKQIDPIETAKWSAVGALAGGGLAAGAHGAGAAFEKLWNKVPRKQAPAAQVNQQVSGQILPREGPMNANEMENIGMIDRAALDPEDLAALDHLQGKMTESVPVASPEPVAPVAAPPAPFITNADRPVAKFEPDPAMPEDPIIKYREYETERYNKAFEPLGSQTAHNGGAKGRREDYYTETQQVRAQDLTDAELDAAWQNLDIEMRRGSTKPYQKKKLEDQQSILSYEQMRRADRRKNGMPENWKKDEFESADTDDLLLMLTGDDELQAQKALAELSKREAKMAEAAPIPEPEAVAPAAVEKPRVRMPLAETQGNLQGERRGMLQIDENGKQILGRDRVGMAPGIEAFSDHVLPPELRALKMEYAKAKAENAYHSDQLNQINEVLIDRFGANGEAQLGPFKLTRVPGQRELNKAGEDLKYRVKAQIDQELPAYIETNRKGGGIRATLDEASINKMPKAVVPEGITEAEAIAMLEKYHSLSQAAAERQKQVRAMFNGENGEDAILLAQQRLRDELGDPNASLQSNIPVLGPDGQVYNVLVEAQNPRQEMPLLWEQFKKAKKEEIGPRGGKKQVPQTEEEFFGDYAEKMGIDTPYKALADQARAGFQRLQDEIAQALAKPQTSRMASDKIKIARTAQLVGGLAGFGAMSLDQGAQAAGVTDNRGNPIIGSGTLVGGALIMASLAHRFGPQAIRNFAKWSGAHAASIYKDTLDHIDQLDKVMATINPSTLSPAAQKVLSKGNKLNGKTLARNIWEHNAAAVMSNWGVDWSKSAKGAKWDGQVTKARSLALLRSRQITSAEALRGKAGTLFEDMTQQQRDAAVGYFLNQKTLSQKVNRFEAEMKAAGIEQLAQVDPNVKNALAAFSYLKDAVAPTSRAFEDGLVDAYHKGLSNAMDFYFFMNPKHHLLNLTDSFIGGGGRVGATRIARAWQWLAADKDIQKVFADSNIVGSWRAEQTNLAAKNATSKALFEHDFPSDRVNANRVALGSLIQYAEDNAARMNQAGFKGDSKQFVKELFQGNLDPSLSMDAGVHMVETLSRTLGVDPYRVNTDWLSRQKFSSSLGVFVKQPARISRLAFTYAKNGEYGKLATMLGMMAFFGGSAVLPIELKKVWENVDPNSYFQVAGALDRYNPYSMISGQNASKKLQWGVNPIGMTTTNPAWTTAYGMAEDVAELYGAYTKLAAVPGGVFEGMTSPRTQGERSQIASKLQKFIGGLTQIVLNRLPGNIPTGETTRLWKQLTPAVTGQTDITYYRDGENRPYHPKEEGVPLNRLGMNNFNPVLNAVLPGEMSGVYQNQNGVLEQKVRQDRRQRVPADQLGYHDPLMRQLATRR